VVPYSFRHAGASHDLVTKERTTAEVKARGRWRSDSSLRRYGKPAKELAAKDKLDPLILQDGRTVESLLDKVFRGEVAIPLPPKIKLT
jgi:hypothetical protein